jgi:hypothetical protein
VRDTELYCQLLGLVEPWQVEGVGLSVKGQKVDVFVGHAKGVHFACP